MGWAQGHITQLVAGKTVAVEPITESTELKVGDAVLCRVSGKEYLHLIKAITGQRYQIGNNRGGVNGWTGVNNIFGRCIKVEK